MNAIGTTRVATLFGNPRSIRLSHTRVTCGTKHSNTSRKQNQPEENLTPRDPLRRASPAGNRRLWEIPYMVLLTDHPKSLRSIQLDRWSVTSSRRRARSLAHDMHDLHETAQRLGIAFGLSIGRFGFTTPNRPNRKPPHGEGGLVELVELVYLFRGCTCERAHPLALARASPPLPPDETDQIDQIDQDPSLYGDYDLVDRETADQTGDQMGVAR